jgi:hypothetical protein
VLGAHMTLTWPLVGPTAFDNIAFGEPSLALGVILLAGSLPLGLDRFWRDTADAASAELTSASWPRLATLLQPLRRVAREHIHRTDVRRHRHRPSD